MRTLSLAIALLLVGAAGHAQGSDPVRRKQALSHCRAGEQLMRAETFEEAAAEFKKAIALEPLLVLAHYNLGQCYMALRRYVEAAAAYRDCRDAVVRVGGLDQRDREALRRVNEDEIQELQRSINEVRAGHIKGVNAEGMIIRLEERIKVLETANQKGPDPRFVPAEVSLALGSAYFRQGRLEDAEREYLEAIKADDKLGAAHNNLAVVYSMTGRLQEALEVVRRAEKAGFPVSSRFKDDLKRRQAEEKP